MQLTIKALKCSLGLAVNRLAELDRENKHLLEINRAAKVYVETVETRLAELEAENARLREANSKSEILEPSAPFFQETQVSIPRAYFEALVEDQKRLDWLESQNYSEFEAATHFKPDEQNPPGKKWGYWREAIDEDRQKKEASK